MPEKDLILRFYRDVLRTNHAHLGLWTPSEDVSIPNLKIAMERYANYLINNVPNGISSILDVGCGWGGIALKLKEKGFQVTALSPDLLQEEHFKKMNTDIPFVLSTYEEYDPGRIFDLALMVESSQYIDIEKGASKSSSILRDGGYVLVADYFIRPEHRSDKIYGSGHNLEDYLKVMKGHNFRLIREEDITDKVSPTLEAAHLFYDSIIPALNFMRDTIKKEYPIIFWIAGQILKRRVKEPTARMLILGDSDSEEIVDAEEFKRKKIYMIYLFQKNDTL